MSDLVVVSALTEIRRLVSGHQPPNPAEVSVHLRALQRRGLSKLDLVIQVERMRATNDALDEDDQTEENALMVLELIEGSPGLGLSWDVVQRAAAWVPLALGPSQIAQGASFALAPSDLLPSRPPVNEGSLPLELAENVWGVIHAREYEPTSADFFRAPKKGLTTRPAALLAPDDRFVFEAFADRVASVSTIRLPNHVVWPRGREDAAGYGVFLDAPRSWATEYVLRTDISSFYESVDHSYLSVVLARSLGLTGAFPIALEAFLDAVMHSSLGLPQGPPGSDVLASAYLMDIDQAISERNWPVARYADDLLVGANSFEEARARARELEAMLRERGLSLANEKTRIIRRSTYVSQLDSEDEPASFRQRVRREVAVWFEENPDPRFEGVIDAIELPEQLQWDLLYHESVSWEEALAEVPDHLLPPWLQAYERIYLKEAARLTLGGYYPDDDDPEVLSASELRRCLLFMAVGTHVIDLYSSHAVIDWHPTLVREMSRYLGVVATISPPQVAEFLRLRLRREHDSDLELAWLLAPAVDNPDLARALREDLSDALRQSTRQLTRATAFRALDNIGALTQPRRDMVLRSFSPALGAEVSLSSVPRSRPVNGPRRALE